MRLASASLNMNEPAYLYSALYYMDANESVWGRKAPQTATQESIRNLDQFQASLQDLDDLRNACEALHVLQLRGVVVRLSGRALAENARALANYNKVPRVLFPRFPHYAEMLKRFESIRAFHEASCRYKA